MSGLGDSLMGLSRVRVNIDIFVCSRIRKSFIRFSVKVHTNAFKVNSDADTDVGAIVVCVLVYGSR